MPTKFCNENQSHIAQTLFLGASVTSFTNNLGWGSQPSQLTVNLVEDELVYNCGNNNPGNMYDQFPTVGGDVNNPNHYHDCEGNGCFIDKYTGNIATDQTPSDNKILPGKVYYELSETQGLVSKYWRKPDPGFFGRKTRIKYDGAYDNSNENSHPNYKFDIIDTPVYFKMGDFQFGGFIQSWTRNISSSKNYTVIINGPQAILNSCYVIIDKYGGSIFSKSNKTNTTFGSPKNYLGSNGANYSSTNLYDGVLPNVFNVYGFIESFGQGYFGMARNTEQGMSINFILESLMALTSITSDSTFKLDSLHRSSQNHAVKRAFSPFGRIISKCMTQEFPVSDAYNTITSGFNKYGVIYPKSLEHMVNTGGSLRCQFVLDLNDILYVDQDRTQKRFSDNIRINGPVLSITDLLNNISDRSGHDFDFELIPQVINQKLYHVIKVKTISRLKQPTTNIIENTIKILECANFPISSNNVGKEKNETPARCLLMGGQQQRLYQVKSYRLAYSQNNFVYNPRTAKFVNYYSLSAGPISGNTEPALTNQYSHGKIRFPNFNSSRNVDVVNSSDLNEDLKTVLNSENEIQRVSGQQFNKDDPTWRTNTELKDGIPVNYGNYEASIRDTHSDLSSSAGGGGRWFPLYADNICPFFGFVYDNKVGLKVGEDNTSNTDFRKIRPVWYDTWTSQIAVVIRVAELPQLNVPINRTYLETNSPPDINGYSFKLPKTANLDPPTQTFNNLGRLNQYEPIEYFLLTESEIRAAIAGFDNFLVYSLAKTYKPDLIELVRRAYYIKTRNQLINNGVEEGQAQKIAYQETDWYWKLLGANIAGDELYPTVVYPDKNDGSQYIQEKALQDLKLIHKFVTEIAKYYGKKYMINAGPLRSYREEGVIGVAFPTNVGYGYVFTGDGTLRYNYTPTNDGAWEETGNIIDDAIVVGGTAWMSLTDDSGKIKPILGYNNNSNYDYIRQAKCIASTKTNAMQDLKRTEANPYFSFNNWLTLHEYKTQSCTDSYVFPSLDISSLSTTDYVIIDQKYNNSSSISNSLPSLSTLPSLNLSTVVKSYDAWGTELKVNNQPLPRSKLYITTSLQEGFVFLNPESLFNARILIDSPGINLNLSSEENAKDPNRTVITNVAAEDLMLYLKTTLQASWDYDWIRYMLNYISPIVLDDAENPYFLGLYTVSANQTANNVELAPKAAHPFFAGIPIKSNQFIYGPWTNYPIINYNDIFPAGYSVTQSSTYPLGCVSTPGQAINVDQAKKAIDNLITNVDIDFNEDLVPWNYGGMYQLDVVALKEIETKINYQAVIETAQLEMAGLPLFSLGGHFVLSNTGVKYTVHQSQLNYIDIKDPVQSVVADLSYIPGASVVYAPAQTNDVEIEYSVVDLRLPNEFLSGPIITSIQTSVSEKGISTSYSFRTYTRKLGLFNKEETDRIKKFNRANLLRGKQIAQINQEINNLKNVEREGLLQERLNKAQFGSADLSSKLFSWSPSTVLIGQASPLINEPSRTPKYIEDFSYSSDPGGFNERSNSPTQWKISQSSDPGALPSDHINNMTVDSSSSTLKSIARVTSTVQLYQRKEVENQLQKDYGMQSAMSLDGLLSPISFYPTFKNSTFAYSLHNTINCPFCNGTKIRDIKIAQYESTGRKTVQTIKIVCDKCTDASKKLNAKIEVESGETPINLITLNPIVVPYGEFKNPNTQNYAGAHPEGAHDDISSASTGLPANQTRVFRDRMRHCIEIVARGSIPQNKAKYALETSRNLTARDHPDGIPNNNLDYSQYDSMLFNIRGKIGDGLNRLHENNQRFFGLRGPLTLHSWGYDEDDYPVPNAEDEPYAYDTYGRPMRFKVSIKYENAAKKFKSLSNGQLFQLISGANNPIYAKTFNNQGLPDLSQGADTNVYVVKVENDLKSTGGFEPTQGYTGDIISKTQKWNGSSWTKKVKLKQFHLNWAERPDLWKVGPIDLYWDSKRMVWTAGGGSEEKTPPYIVTNSNDLSTLDEFYNKKSNKKYIYRMIYATLEEDLVKQPDFDETFATRAFIDDVEFSKEPLLQGYRRLIYIKDKCGYTAPIGTKLLCRYNRLTGFYEPVTKPTVATKGRIINGSSALIDLNYVQGRRAGKVPTRTITFDNPLSFNTISGTLGIFMFMSGKWTLTATK